MKFISGYKIIEKIESKRRSSRYRVCKNDKNGDDGVSGEIVVLELFDMTDSTFSEIARFRQECLQVKNCEINEVIKIYDVIQTEHGLALVMEELPSFSLKEKLQDGKTCIQTFLKTGIKICEVLEKLSEKNIVHGNVRPESIFLIDDLDQIKISNFGILGIITHKNENIYDSQVVKNIMAYISPEQTGRMNRAVDYRTDIYSLGIIFYEMLTGDVPFISDDPMEMIYSHVAREPVPVSEKNPAISIVISMMLEKMLKKNTEERYQSFRGVKYDLLECIKKIDQAGKVEFFELARNDIAAKFNMPQKLCGRQHDIEFLLETFDRVINSGNSELVLVTGNSGVGKSALINEIRIPTTVNSGYFISGKYDKFKINVPYSSIIQAFQNLTRQILSESEDKINIWKERLLDSLGDNGKIITNVIPDVELIIGKQNDVSELDLDKAQNRFNFTFKNFVKAFLSREHPLVLFLDDLQWADRASLNMMKSLITDSDVKYLFLIGAYRNNQIDQGHILKIALDEIRTSGTSFCELVLSTLDVGNVNQLVSSFLRCHSEVSRSLAELIHKKTNGNPFFVNQFLKTLYEENMLGLDPEEGWKWSVPEIEKMRMTDNVVELMIDKISKLPASLQEILKIASCIGNRFELRMISTIMRRSIDSILVDIRKILQGSLLYFEGDIYYFFHDRIQEAAYSLLTDGERKKLHCLIGDYALKSAKNSNELFEKIFYIVGQLNSAGDQISGIEKRCSVASLNLIAGKKAKASVAYLSAQNYLKIGIEHLGENDWNEQMYETSLDFRIESMEVAYLNTDYIEMEKFSAQVLTNGRSFVDKSKVYELGIGSLIAQGKLKEAIDYGLKVLDNLGVNFPRRFYKFHILMELLKNSLIFRGERLENINKLPVLEDRYILSIIKIISSIFTAAYFGKPELFPLLVIKIVRISLKYGNSSLSPYAYATYGLILCGLGRIKGGGKFGRLAMSLVKKTGIAGHNPRTEMVYHGFIAHWESDARKTISPLSRIYQRALAMGDVEFASHSIMISCYHMVHCGFNLNEISDYLEKSYSGMKQLNRDINMMGTKIHRQQILHLIGKDEYLKRLSGTVYNEEEMLPLHIKSGDKTSLFSHFNHKSFLHYLFRDFLIAFESIKQAEKSVDAAFASLAIVPFYFYSSMIRLAILDDVSTSERRKLLRKVSKNQRKLKKWAISSPLNCLHKYRLVCAKIANIKGNIVLAEELYEKAIKGAGRNGFMQDEAIATELASRFYFSRRLYDIANSYIIRSRDCYEKWGAIAKVRFLEKEFPVLQEQNFSKEPILADLKSSGKNGNSLDLATIMKTTCAISGEVVLSDLMAKIMESSIENAGATKGYLVLVNKGELVVEVDGNIIDHKLDDFHDNLSLGIVRYVERTGQMVVLNDAVREGDFTNDLYVIKMHSKSILCIPIINQRKMIAILYLENDLATNVFTEERVEVLTVLSAQAAISMENSRLYEETRDANIKLIEQENIRTAFFNNTSHELRTPLNGILGLCQLMLQGMDNDKVMDNLSKVKSLAESLKMQVNTILELAKFKKGELELVADRISLDGLVTECENLGRGLMSVRSDIEFKIVKSWNEKSDASFITDSEKLMTILRNLLGNAFKYLGAPTDNRTSVVKLEFKFDCEENKLLIKCSDTGIGIPEEQLGGIFEEFKQVEFNSRRSYEGSGLGLTLVRDLVNLMGGTIHVESSVGNGSTFTVNIPEMTTVDLTRPYVNLQQHVKKAEILPMEISNVEKNIDRVCQVTEQKLSKYKILIIDDNEINVEVAEGILNSAGFNVDSALGGREGLEKIEEEAPDLVILDLMMPEVSGEDVLEKIRLTERTKNIPVILVTARASTEDCILGLELGCDDYLAKPIIAEELVLRVKSLLGRIELTRKIATIEEEMIQQEKMAQIGTMLGDLSHELKNLTVHAVTGFSEVKDSIKGMHQLYCKMYSGWDEIMNSLFVDGIATKEIRKRKKWFKIPEDSDHRDLLVKVHRSLLNLNVDDEFLGEIWKKIVVLNDDGKLRNLEYLLSVTRFVVLTGKSSKNSLDIIHAVLDYSRESMDDECHDIGFVVKSCLYITQKRWIDSEINIESNINQNLWIEAVSSDMHQIILNLLSNAYDALKESDQQEKVIKIFSRKSGSKLILSIEDNGINGIPFDIQSRIFERNFSTKGEQGSGIGLFVSNKLARKNNILLKLNSRPGKTVFNLELNLVNKK